MLIRCLLGAVLAVGCISKAKQALAPEPEGGGTLSCREIVETCDSECSDPLCLHQCTSQGTQDAQGPHAALLDCGQRNSCTSEDCMKASCPTEIETCMGPVPAAAPTEPAATPPSETPSPQ